MRTIPVAAGLAILALAVGCGQRVPADQPATVSVNDSASEVIDSAAKPNDLSAASDAEAMALGEKLESAIRRKDAPAFVALFDLQHLRDAVGMEPMPKPQVSSEEGRDEDRLRNLLQAVSEFAEKELVQSVEAIAHRAIDDGSYTFLGVRNRADGERLLFRILKADGGQ
jgi:hypothetical protein